jgi:ABC-type transporter Mla subunit MlaD
MNNARRKAITEAMDKALTVIGTLEESKRDLESLHDEEQDAFDNMPESLQQSERGQASETAISELDEVITKLGEAIDAINDAWLNAEIAVQ